MRRREGGMFLAGVMLYGLLVDCFYRSLVPFALFPAVYPFFRRWCIRQIQERQRERMKQQFRDFLLSVSSAMKVGYSMENALGEALKETEKVYGADGVFTEELREMERKRNLNQSLEFLWADFGKRSGMEDIENFGEIFQVARRSGGNLKEIIRSTADNISRKTETRREIEISLASKKMEQKIMSAVPFFILAYVDLGSPEFLEGLYHNTFGILLMTVCLGLYLIAFFWGRRIVEIEV